MLFSMVVIYYAIFDIEMLERHLINSMEILKFTTAMINSIIRLTENASHHLQAQRILPLSLSRSLSLAFFHNIKYYSRNAQLHINYFKCDRLKITLFFGVSRWTKRNRTIWTFSCCVIADACTLQANKERQKHHFF